MAQGVGDVVHRAFGAGQVPLDQVRQLREVFGDISVDAATGYVLGSLINITSDGEILVAIPAMVVKAQSHSNLIFFATLFEVTSSFNLLVEDMALSFVGYNNIESTTFNAEYVHFLLVTDDV
jgi:hypothetical protein